MGNCATIIRKFHDEEVKLSEDERRSIRKQAESNQELITSRLKSNGDPEPIGFWTQGSYAMRTMIQRPNKDYDIDAGCYFKADDIEDKNITPLALRRKVCNAADDGRFTTSPEVKKNCVRIQYNEGHHIDVPAYKAEEDESGDVKFVLLSSADDWKDSDPQGVTDWFKGQVENHKPGELRKLVRMLKAFCPNSPSGLILSVLASGTVISDDDDDDMLYTAFRDIKVRLDLGSPICHPVVQREILASCDSDVIIKLRGRLASALNELEAGRSSGKKSNELNAWKKVFGDHSFFDRFIREAKEEEKKGGESDNRKSILGGVAAATISSAAANPKPVQAPRPFGGEDDQD